jgi:tellurite methyltransferase
MREQHDHRGEEAVRDVAADIGAAQTEHGCADEPEEAEADRGEKRLSQEGIIDDLPSPFVVDWLPCVVADLDGPWHGPHDVRPAAIDLAMGRGRHAQLLARAGFRTFGVDVKLDAVRDAAARARADRLIIRGWCADLTRARLPRGFFDVGLVTRYLQRDLFSSIRAMMKPGGLVLYETFTVHQRRLGFGPTSPDHLLEPGELRRHFEGFEVLFYEEVEMPEAVARIVARRPDRARSAG